MWTITCSTELDVIGFTLLLFAGTFLYVNFYVIIHGSTVNDRIVLYCIVFVTNIIN